MQPRRPIVASALVWMALSSTAVVAQDAPLLLEVYGGGAIPVGSFAEGTRSGEGTTADAGLAVSFVLPGTGRRTLYAGFAQNRFGCEDAGCTSDGRYVATGFNVGARFALVRGHAVIPWLRVGAVTTRVETVDLGGDDAGVSDLGFGAEVGAGVYIGANSPVALVPAVLYSAVNTTLPGGATLRMRYLTAQLGVAFAF